MHEANQALFWTALNKQSQCDLGWDHVDQAEDFQESDLPPSSPKFDEMLPSLRESPNVVVDEDGVISRISDSQVVPSLEASMMIAVTRYNDIDTVVSNTNQCQSEDDQAICKRLTYKEDFPDPFLNTTYMTSEQCAMRYETAEQTVEDLQIYLPPELSPTPLDKLYSTFPYTPEERLFQFPYLDETRDVNHHMDLINRGIKDQEKSEEVITNINRYSDQDSTQSFDGNRYRNVGQLKNVPDLLFRASDDCNLNDRRNVSLFRGLLFRKADNEIETTHAEQSDDLGLQLRNSQVDNSNYSRKRQLVLKAPKENSNTVIFLDENSPENSRLSHNDIERQRRNEMKGRFDSLKSAIPDITGVDRSPKILVLRKAKDFINELHSEEERLDKEKIYERDRNRKLLQKLVNLTGGFN